MGGNSRSSLYRLVARWRGLHPGGAIMIVPLASCARLSPPTVLLILNHQLLQLLVEFLVGKSAGFVTPFDLSVTAVCFVKIHFLILRLGHLALVSGLPCLALSLF